MNATTHRTLAAIALVCLTALPFGVREQLPAWVFMWVLAFALYAGCKLLTFVEAGLAMTAGNPVRPLGYLLLWPGMDPKPFIKERNPDQLTIPRFEWFFAFAKMALGAALIWLVVPHLTHATGRAWTGMVGVIFLLHFGLFHVLALVWQTRRIAVRPLMQNPVCATSLAEFWGQRWNSGFHDLVHRYVFRPAAKRFGVNGAMLAVFLVSGLIHELVITVPARGGYGLPTLYFMLQGLGLALERTNLGKACGMGRGITGWAWMLAFTAGPVVCLFPTPFLRNVILPMLETIT